MEYMDYDNRTRDTMLFALRGQLQTESRPFIMYTNKAMHYMLEYGKQCKIALAFARLAELARQQSSMYLCRASFWSYRTP